MDSSNLEIEGSSRYSIAIGIRKFRGNQTILSWLTTTWFLYGQLSVDTTGETIPLLVGNITSISVGAGIAVIGSLARPAHFNFEVMKQRILVVDEKIRSIIEKDTDDSLLIRYERFVWYSILSIVLVIVWPLPLYFSGYVFSLQPLHTFGSGQNLQTFPCT